MEKVIYVVRRPDDEGASTALPSLLRERVGPALADAGALAVRVHVLDDDAAPGAGVFPAGHRRITLDPPFEAMVSIWLDSAVSSRRAPIDAVLADAGLRVDGFLVSESVPLADDRPVAAGERTPGYTQVALLQVPEGQTHRAWRSRWQDHHTDVAVDTQSTTAYRQNLVVHPLDDDAPPIAAIVEETFPIEALTDHHAFFDAVGDDERFAANVTAMVDSTSTFIDTDRGLDTLPASEYVLRPLSPRR